MRVHSRVEVVQSGLRFPEAMRWHEDALWFSDMHAGTVHVCDPLTGATATRVSLGEPAGGLDWLPDGSLLVSAMRSRRVLRFDHAGESAVFAELSASTEYLLNDLTRDPVTGCLYVGDFGYHLYEGDPFRQATLWMVDDGGSVHAAASDLDFPNTAVLLPGTRTLVLPETFGARLTAFDILEGGALGGRREWAPLTSGTRPDGCCVDDQGAVWVATLDRSEFVRLLPGGAITDVVTVPGRLAVDCVLSGDGTTLFLATADHVEPSVTAVTRRGRIERVDVGGTRTP